MIIRKATLSDLPAINTLITQEDASDYVLDPSTFLDQPVTTFSSKGELEKFLADQYSQIFVACDKNVVRGLVTATKNGEEDNYVTILSWWVDPSVDAATEIEVKLAQELLAWLKEVELEYIMYSCRAKEDRHQKALVGAGFELWYEGYAASITVSKDTKHAKAKFPDEVQLSEYYSLSLGIEEANFHADVRYALLDLTSEEIDVRELTSLIENAKREAEKYAVSELRVMVSPSVPESVMRRCGLSPQMRVYFAE